MSDPQQMPIAKLEFEEARQLADRAAIFQDLTFVLAVLDRLQELHEEQGEDVDSVVMRAYWTAALTAYVRCFSSGKRLGLTEAVFEGAEGGVDAHRRFKAMRDKHVAHSVNPFEQVDVGAILAPPLIRSGKSKESQRSVSCSLGTPWRASNSSRY